MRKKLLILIILLLFVILIIGGFMIFYYLQGDNKVIQESKEQIDNQIEKQEIVKKDLFEDYYVEAEEIMEDMTIEEKVGQMFLVRYDSQDAIYDIQTENPGGYVLFSKDFNNQTKESIRNELDENQQNSKINMFFAVDEEGGTVVRVSNHKAFRSSKFKSPRQLYEEGGLELILEDSKEKSELLKSIGINMNLAPVADISNSSEDFIYDRSLGGDAQQTSEYVSEVVKLMNEYNLVSSIKHFPGYGNNRDTHTGFAIDLRNYEEFENSDFLPFISGIEVGAPTILVSHNIVGSMDQNYPASLSENVHKILREELEFSGLIITDDLAMRAIEEYAENGEAAVLAVQSGNDVIITSDFKNQKQQVLNAVQDGELSEDVIDFAVRRILACKLKYGIIEM